MPKHHYLGILFLVIATPAVLCSSPARPQAIQPPPLKLHATIEMPRDTDGVDFKPYLQSIYRSVSHEWFASLSPDFQRDKGTVVMQFRIQQDQRVPDEFIKVISNSGPKELEYAARNAIRGSRNGFDHLPSNFSKPFIEIRMNFFYNTTPTPGPAKPQNTPQSGL